jgi:transcriptional regulator with XRE-family HTH domain
MRGYTQVQMASLLSMTQSAYNQLENEKYKINVEMLCKLADILNCTTDLLLGRITESILEKNKDYYEKLLLEDQDNS